MTFVSSNIWNVIYKALKEIKKKETVRKTDEAKKPYTVTMTNKVAKVAK